MLRTRLLVSVVVLTARLCRQRSLAAYARTVDSAQPLDRRRGAVQTALAVASIQAFDYSVSLSGTGRPAQRCCPAAGLDMACLMQCYHRLESEKIDEAYLWRRMQPALSYLPHTEQARACPAAQGAISSSARHLSCHGHRSVCERPCRWHTTAMMDRSARAGSLSSRTQWRWPSSWQSSRWMPCPSLRACCTTLSRTATRSPLTR